MIKVLQSGLYSTIQDLGRYGYREFGIPRSGVMDSYAAKLANLLVGNSENEAVIELTMLGPKLEFQCDTNISITGANMSSMINDKVALMNTVIKVSKGDVLSFGALKTGMRAYLAVSGGIQSTSVMDSRSMFLNLTEKTSLDKYDVIPIKAIVKKEKASTASVKPNYKYLNQMELEVYPGPEFNQLPAETQDLLVNSIFSISKDHNRMGYRLEEMIYNELDQILTSPVLPGTVQLTPSGRIIILMRDAQTTGGYPRIFQLNENAINTLAQKKTADKIRFNLIK